MLFPTSDPAPTSTGGRFGLAGFAAGALTMLALELITWFLMPMWIFVPFIVTPIVAVIAGISYGLTKIPATAQIGRGMLISCLAAPLSIALAFAAIVVFQAAG